MENNLNQKVIRRYSQEFAAKVAPSFFGDHEKVTNDTIMEVQPIRQVNLFVVKNLFDQWQQEIRKLRSPYFNYDDPRVAESMETLKNVLSRSIEIRKEDYIPLLEKSVEETLRLILSPYDYYKDLVSIDEELLTLDYLKTTSRYMKVNPFIIEALLKKIEEENAVPLTRQRARKLLDEVVDQLNDEPDDVEPHIDSFSAIHPLTLDELYGTVRKNSYKEPEEGGRRTLYDNLVKEDQATLADMHQRQRISDIRSHLTINQRFMFVNSLFDGNEARFQETIDRMESSASPAEAIEYLEENFSHWENDSDEVEEFYAIVRRRLAQS